MLNKDGSKGGQDEGEEGDGDGDDGTLVGDDKSAHAELYRNTHESQDTSLLCVWAGTDGPN